MNYTLEKLIEELLLRYSDKLPDKELTSYELGVLVGQQKVINHLKAIDSKKKP